MGKRGSVQTYWGGNMELFKEFKERYIQRLEKSGNPVLADPQVRAQIAGLAVEVLKNLEAEGKLQLPQTAECSPELLSAVEKAVAKVAAELQRELERKIEKAKEEIKEHEVEVGDALAAVIGKAGGEVKARIELAKDELRQEIKEAKNEIIREQQDLAYLSSRTF